MGKNKINEIVFEYNSHNNILTKIKYEDESGNNKTVTSNIIMKIEEEKENKYFSNEKIVDNSVLLENFKNVFYYDRITATLETDVAKKNKLNEIFNKDENVKNILFIMNGEDIVVFENIDTKDIKFQIANHSLSKKHNFDNFKEVFYSANIKEPHLDIINSFRFSYVSYTYAKDLINKISRNMANTLIREYPEAFEKKVTLNDSLEITTYLSEHFYNKYSLETQSQNQEKLFDVDEVLELDKQSLNYFENQILLIEQIADIKNLRNYKNFVRILESEEADEISKTNIPLQNEIERIRKIRFDTLLLNLENESNNQALSEFYKNNRMGNICIQSDEKSFLNKNFYALPVDKDNLQLSMSASLSQECSGINKILDLRKIEDLDHRKKIFTTMFSDTNENITIITSDINDAAFIHSRIKNGNIYKMDAKYLGEDSDKPIYIADILEISYSYEMNFNQLVNPNLITFEKRIIDFPKYNESQSQLLNLLNIKTLLTKKIMSHKEFNTQEATLSGKLDSLYKYEKLFNTGKDFNIFNMSKEYQTVKKSEEFYAFAKGNIGKFFKGNLELIFSSFNVAKEKKVFNNDFYYNSSSTLSISDLEKSIALSSHISRMPTGEIISKIAKKFNINVVADKPFSLSNIEQNKLNIGKKDFVTSTKLGAMKFGYLPKTFELKTEDKEVLIDMVATILKRNETINEDILKKEIDEFRQIVQSASYLTLKNEQTVTDVSKFSPKEVLVLIDENLKDISKLNISISEFYKELEDKNIFNIDDYVEVAKVNSNSLERITIGLSNMISDFREEQLKFSGIDLEKFNETIGAKNIPIGAKSYSALEILISNASKPIKDKVLYDLGVEFNIMEYYKTFLNFDDTQKLIEWIDKQGLNTKQKEKLTTLLTTKFIGNEVPMIEQKSLDFFAYIQETVGADNKELYEKIEEKIFKLYNDKKTENTIITKTMKLYAIESLMTKSLNDLKQIDKTLPKQEQTIIKSRTLSIMKKTLDITALEIMGLTEHQYQEALNFSVLKNNDMKDTQMLFWEMRQGKTRAAIASKLFTSFINSNRNLQRNLMLVQNKNIEDIAEQVVDFFPILSKDIIFNSSEEVYLFKKSKNLDLPVNIAKQITPQIIQMLKENIKFQGQKDSLKSDTVILANTYTKDMNQIYKQLSNLTTADLMEKFKNSPFVEILTLTNMKKVDKDIEKSIMQSFLYIQMIFEKKFLKPSDAEVALEKMKKFVERYIHSKETLKENKLSKFGLDLIPKTIMYSINVDSPVTNITLDKKNERRVHGKGYISTPYEIAVENNGEILLTNFEAEYAKKDFAEILANNFALPKSIRELTTEGKVFKKALSGSNIEILDIKEKILTSFIEKICKNPSPDFAIILEEYVRQQKLDTNLVASPIYKIEGLDEQVKDTIEVSLSDIFKVEKVDEFLRAYETLNSKEVEDFISALEDSENVVNFATNENTQYYNTALYYLYDTTLSATSAKRLELIAPLVAKKCKELASSFVMDMELKTNTLIYPIRKANTEGVKKHFYDMFTLYNDTLNIEDLSSSSKKSIEGLQLEFSYANSNPQFIVKREQNPDLLLDLIVKRNENLNNTYLVDLKPDIANVSVDESHKGMKKQSTTLNIHDVTSYLHKLAISNDGTFTSISGTPMSGMARDIGKIMTTGIESSLSANITKNIDAYCTSYEFKDDFDAMLFAALDMFPNGKTYKAFEKTITIPEDRKNIKIESLELLEDEIRGIKKEISAVINSIPNLDSEEKKELISSKTSVSSIVSKFNYYKELYNTEDNLQKLMDSKTIRRKDNEVKTLLVNKIDFLARKVPGINNFATLSDIIRKVGSSNSVNISRVSEDAKYNILDLDILKKQTDTKDIKHPKAIKLENYKDKTLALAAFLDSYKSKLKLGEIKEKLNQIFESWVIDMFSQNNYNKTVRYLGLDDKLGLKETSHNGFEVGRINELMSRSGKSINDSATDIFNILYFGSDKEKIELSTNKDLKEKVEFVINIIDKFIDFSKKYVEFQAKAKVLFENEKAKSKEESREIENIPFAFDGFTFDATKYEDLSPSMDNLHLFEPQVKTDNYHVVSLTNDGGVKVDNTPIVFKTELAINKWEHFLNKAIDLQYSLTNKGESEILEYLASDSTSLYTEHLNKGENIRLMSGRNANLVISFMDAIKSLIDRENKDKKAILIFNKNSSKSFDFNKIIEAIDKNILQESNIELRISKSSTFPSALHEAQKNKNNQLVIVGNYIALAEGINMSCIDTGFYIGSLRESAETIQSFARQRNHEKTDSNIYLGNNGLLERYKINTTHKLEDFTINNTPFKSMSKSLFRGGLELKAEVNSELKSLEQINFYGATSSIVLSTNITLARLEAYEAVMSGRYPAQQIDYANKSLLSYSDYYIKKEQAKEINNKTVIESTESIEIEEDKTLGVEIK